MKKSLKLIALSLGALLLSSCYNRSTGNYDEFPDIHDNKSAIVDENGLSDEEIEMRRTKLREMNHAKPPEFKINSGDSLSVVVYDHSDLNMNTIVTPDGCIGMVFVGQLKIAGKTLTEAAHAIEETLSQFIKNPSVAITPNAIRSETATIAGAVSKPGMYPISDGTRLADLYSKAGGSSIRFFDGQDLDAADLTKSILVRDGAVVEEIDFKLAIESGDPDHNVILHKGDYVYIAVRSESMVCLIGDVGHSIKRVWDNNLGLLELLTSGGFVRETYWPYAIIIRGGIANPTLYKVDIDSILQGRKPNILLKPNDVVYLPHDNISEYNVFVRKLLPTGTLYNLIHGVSHTQW